MYHLIYYSVQVSVVKLTCVTVDLSFLVSTVKSLYLQDCGPLRSLSTVYRGGPYNHI